MIHFHTFTVYKFGINCKARILKICLRILCKIVTKKDNPHNADCLYIFYFNGYFSVKALTIAFALGAAASPSLIIIAIASAI